MWLLTFWIQHHTYYCGTHYTKIGKLLSSHLISMWGSALRSVTEGKDFYLDYVFSVYFVFDLFANFVFYVNDFFED